MMFSLNLNAQAQNIDSISTYMQQYEYQKVIAQMDKRYNDSTDLELIDLKAKALKGLSKYQEAIQEYKKIFRSDTTDLRTMIELAICYQSISDFKNAQKFYKKALRISSQNNFLNKQLADAYYQDEDFKSAIIYYYKAYKVDSSYVLSKQLGRCYDSLGKTDSAINYYNQALNLNSIDVQATYRLANLYKQNQDYATAISITDSFLDYDSTNVKILKLNGYLNFLDKNFINATNSFENCISLNDTSDFTYKYLGYCYFKTKEYQKAKDYLEISFQNDTTNIELCYALGLSCDYSVYKKLGIYYLGKSIELATPSSKFLSQVYQDLGVANTGFYKYDEALDAYLKAYELTPNDTLLIYKIASHYDNWIKDKHQALKYYHIFMETRPIESKPLPKMPVPGGIVVSYYDFVERRMGAIKEELFWKGEKPDSTTLK